MRVILFLVFILVSYCTSQDRCSVRDSNCQRNYFQAIATQYARTGIPSMGIPVIDPFKINNVVMPILGLWNVTASGEAEGIGKCIVTKYESNLDEWWREANILCKKIIVRGYYKITTAPVVKEACNWCEVHGEGYGSLTFEDWYFKFRYPFKFEKRKEKIYLKPFFENTVYEAKAKHVKIEANNIKMGNLQLSKLFTDLINQTPVMRIVMSSDMGKFVNDISYSYYVGTYDTFFTKAPADQFLSDNMPRLLAESERFYAANSKQTNCSSFSVSGRT